MKSILMLNKELLMGTTSDGESFKHHILLTVGENPYSEEDEGEVGWYYAVVGAVNKIPVFFSGAIRLDMLAYKSKWGELQLEFMPWFADSQAPEISYFDLRVSTPYASVTLEGHIDADNTSYVYPVDGDPLNFRGNVGNTIPIYFDPQPDGYLDPETLKPI